MAHFNVGNGFHNVVFSGDTKYEKTWLFNPANTRFIRLESLIMESTYGGRNDMQASRTDASKELHDLLQRATENGGKVLIPVFAVGRSQEVMLVIEEMMRNGRLPKMNVYLDGMIWEATAIHTAFRRPLRHLQRHDRALGSLHRKRLPLVPGRIRSH